MNPPMTTIAGIATEEPSIKYDRTGVAHTTLVIDAKYNVQTTGALAEHVALSVTIGTPLIATIGVVDALPALRQIDLTAGNVAEGLQRDLGLCMVALIATDVAVSLNKGTVEYQPNRTR
jgi:hypothetical protein